MDNVTSTTMAARLTLDREISDLIGLAYEEYKMDGIRYASNCFHN
jgi:hypothetical protein